MKKQITTKLHLNKETLRHLSDRDLQSVVGGFTWGCVETGLTYCEECPSESCITGGSCLTLTNGQFCC
jgi:natural product precursor